METKFYLTEEFKELHLKWRDKLKDSGFDEIESGDSGRFLKLWHSTYFFAVYSAEEVQESSDYFRMASEFYWLYPFKNELQKEAWRLHAEGYSRRKIAQTMTRQGHKISGDSIQIIVSSLKKIMHARKWQLSEDGHESRENSKDGVHGV